MSPFCYTEFRNWLLHRYCRFTENLSLSFINTSEAVLVYWWEQILQYHRPTAHQMVSIEKKRKKNVNGNEFVLWKWGLQLQGSIDRSETAAMSMSILIRCPSLIVEEDQTPLPPTVLPPSVSLYSVAAPKPSCDVRSIRGEKKQNAWCWVSQDKLLYFNCNTEILLMFI